MCTLSPGKTLANPLLRRMPIMAISFRARLLRSLAFLLLLLPYAAESSGMKDVLKQYGLPKGLFPHGAKDYALNPDGSFVVRLKRPCYVQSADLFYYATTITGKISYGFISDISGIQIKKLLVWFPISSIRADVVSESVELKIGFLCESFPWKLFKETPDCMNESKFSIRSAANLFSDELLPVPEV